MLVDCPGCQARYDVSGRPPGTQARCRCGCSFTLPDPPEAAATMSCPQCGASTDSTKPACDYCQSPLALVRCPRCFGAVFAGAKHCRHCGVRVDEPAVRHLREGAEENRPCPRCKSASNLDGLLAGDMLVDHCSRCGGLWLDHAVFERLQTAEELRAPAVISLAQLPKPTGEGPTHGYIPCPDCEKLMTPRNFAKRSGIIIDACKAHGLWFDAGELPAIVEYIQGGGLDESRRRDREELENEKRKMKSDAAMLAAQPERNPVAGGHWQMYGDSPTFAEPILRLIGSLFRI